MMERIGETSPRFEARITGAFYLLTHTDGDIRPRFRERRPCGRRRRRGYGDQHTDAQELVSVYLIEMACQIAMTALFYDLLKPAGRSVSLVAAFLGLTGCTIKTLSRLFFIAPLFILGGAHYLSVFSTEQLQALALLFLRVNDHGA